MHKLCIAIAITNFIIVSSQNIKIEKLPRIFQIDNYEQCKEEHKLFCKLTIVLKPLEPNRINKFWQFITNLKTTKRHYNHDELFHAICVQNICPEINTTDDISRKLSKCYTEKFKEISLLANVTQSNCTNHEYQHPRRIFDTVFLLLVVSYLFYVAFATAFDLTMTKTNVLKSKCILPFSLKSNWQKLCKPNCNPDFQRLKAIQGIRFYNMMLIIFAHTYSSYIGGYVFNTEYFEQIDDNPIRLGIRNLFVFLVQPFFLFSAFLLSYHSFQVMAQNEQFQKKTMQLSFINRYLRILPPLLVMILLDRSIWIANLFYGPIKTLVSDEEFKRCQTNWWKNLLFISNYFDHQDMCFFFSWYLSADTQLYLFSLVILSLIWKYKHLTRLIIGASIIIGVVIQIGTNYYYDLNVAFKMTPENCKNNNYRSFEFNASYTSTFSNMTTYMLGLAFGLFYFKYKDEKLFQKIHEKIIWFLLFISLPIGAIIFASYDYNTTTAAILSGLLKPMYACGIAIGVLGMSYKIGGIIRNICEWNFAVFMGNFTYSTFIVQFGTVFPRTAIATETFIVSDYVLLISSVQDIIVSFFVGFCMHILVEMPALQLQKMFIPQVKIHRKVN